MSPIGAGVELERAALGGRRRNFTRDAELERRYQEALDARRGRELRKLSAENRATGGCTGHMAISALRSWVPEAFLRDAVKFTSERHPYEKAVSLAHFGFRGDPSDPTQFSDFLDLTVSSGAYTGFQLYSIDGASVMDDYVLFDSIPSDLKRILSRLGLGDMAALPRARAGNRNDRTPATQILNDHQKAVVRKRCAAEFELFGWPQ